MTNITPDINAVLRSRGVTPIIAHRYSIDQLDSFLAEAYNIVRPAWSIVTNFNLTSARMLASQD